MKTEAEIMAALRLLEADSARRSNCICEQCHFRTTGNAFMAAVLRWVTGGKDFGEHFEKALANIRDDETTAKYLHNPKTA